MEIARIFDRSVRKPLLRVLLVAGLVWGFTGQAATLIVDNDVSHDGGHFVTIQDALNAAVAGDTIMVLPSQVSYSGASIGKSVTIMGPGFGGRSVIGPFQDLHAEVGSLKILGGVSNVIITGLKLGVVSIEGERTGRTENGNTVVPGSRFVSDILIIRNWFVGGDDSISLTGNSNGTLNRLVVVNNDIRGDIGFGGDSYVLRWTTESFFFNNRIWGRLKFSDVGIGNPRGESSIVDNYAVIENNIITGGVELGKGRFRNNIVMASSIYNRATTVSQNVFIGEWPTRYDNFFWGTQLDPPYIPGVNRLAPAIEDVLKMEGNWWQFWELTEESPARGYASDGGDVGVFGGLHPWDREQMPPIPYISEFRAPVLVNQGQPIRVEVEIDLNN